METPNLLEKVKKEEVLDYIDNFEVSKAKKDLLCKLSEKLGCVKVLLLDFIDSHNKKIDEIEKLRRAYVTIGIKLDKYIDRYSDQEMVSKRPILGAQNDRN